MRLLNLQVKPETSVSTLTTLSRKILTHMALTLHHLLHVPAASSRHLIQKANSANDGIVNERPIRIHK